MTRSLKLLSDYEDGAEFEIEQAELDRWLERLQTLRVALTEGLVTPAEVAWCMWADETPDN